MAKQRIEPMCEELRQLYAEQGMTMRMIAERYVCSTATISVWLRRCGIATRSGRFEARAIPEEALRQLYLIERQPLATIAAHFGVSIATLYNRRRSYGIPTRQEQDSWKNETGVAH
jgi:hypothetical protein